jgi:hypothetical protein
MVIATLIVLALWATTVRSATLIIGRSLDQGAGAKHQHTYTCNQTFGDFHGAVSSVLHEQKRDFEPGSKSLGLVSLGADLPA